MSTNSSSIPSSSSSPSSLSAEAKSAALQANRRLMTVANWALALLLQGFLILGWMRFETLWAAGQYSAVALLAGLNALVLIQVALTIRQARQGSPE